MIKNQPGRGPGIRVVPAKRGASEVGYCKRNRMLSSDPTDEVRVVTSGGRNALPARSGVRRRSPRPGSRRNSRHHRSFSW